MEACAIRDDVRFIMLRRSSHATVHTHLLQHLFTVIAQLLVEDEDDRSLGLKELAPMEKHARCTHTSTYGVPTTWCVPSRLYSFCARCLSRRLHANDDVGEIFYTR